jgi:hypothetical protein
MLGVPAALTQPAQAADAGFSVRRRTWWDQCGSILYTEAMGFEKKRLLAAFKVAVYPLRRAIALKSKTHAATDLQSASP